MSTFSELIDFTRSSTGTYLDSVVYGDELVTNGTFDTDSDWAKGTGWAISGGTASKTAGTGSSIVSTTLSGTIGKSYLLTFDLTLSAGVINSTLGASVTPVYDSSGSYAEILKPTTTGAFYFYGSAAFAGSIDNVSVKEIIGGQGTAGTPLLRTADTNEPRLEYDASGQPLGLLIEEQRTNLISSSNFNNVTKENVTTVNDYAVAPDGTNTAVAMFETTNNYFHRAYNTASFLNGNTYTQSVFLKSIGGRAGQLTMTSSGFGTIHANFDLVNGVVGTKNNCESQITPVGNGWYRCSITATAIGDSGGDASVVSVTSPTSARLENYAGDTSKGLLVYGLQVELGAFPTSYIPTSGSTVTRNSDLAPIPVERFAFDASEGTLFVHAVTASGLNTTTGQCAVSLSSGATANCYRLRKNVSTEEIGMLKRVGDSNVININGKIVGETSTFKACGNYSATGLSLSIDGEDVITGSASSSTITISKLDVGTSPFGDADCFNGHIKRIQYFPTKLSNDELVELTKPSSSPTMSLTFDGQATSELVEGLHD
jgi:hypothetical protein